MSSKSNSGEKTRTTPSTGADGSADERRTFGPYEIRKRIGAGGMGAVYLAVETETNRTVALKVLPKEKASNPTLVKRFKAEARSAAQLTHENIVRTYGAGEIDGYLFIALEYVDGKDIHELVRHRGVIPVRRSIDIVKQAARALEHAYEQGIVHRDIKPSNLMIRRDGSVKLTDMGLARSVDDNLETGITRAGMTVGTVDYMAPEQARNSKSADVRSDIYSLGCTWYHMLTGQPPFSDGNLTNKLHGHASASRPDPRDLNESVPEGVVHVLQKMMAVAPKERYQSPTDLLTDLESSDLMRDALAENLHAALSEGVHTEPGSKSPKPAASRKRTLPPRKKRRKKKKKSMAGVSADQVKIAGVAIGVIGLIVALWWVTSQFATVFDSPSATRPRNPFASGDDPDQTGAGNGGQPSANGATPPGGPSGPRVKPPGKGPPPDGGRPDSKPKPPAVVKTVPPIKPQPGSAGPPIGIERSGERPFFPDWVAATPSQAHPTASTKLKTVSVGRTSGGAAKFADLKTALGALPPQGGVIQLVGDGPFFLPPTTVIRRGTIVVTASSTARPLVVLVPDNSVPDNDARHAAVLTVRNSSLTFLGVHLFVDSAHFSTEGKQTLVEVQSGSLTVRNGSVTVRGERDGDIVAFRVSDSGGPQDASGQRILLDRLFLRGDRCTAIEITSPAAEVVATNCLFLTGTAPVMRLSPRSVEAMTESPLVSRNSVITSTLPEPTKTVSPKQRDSIPLRRVLRLISCTSVGQHTGFEFSADVNQTASMTDIVVVNSLFATDQVGGETVLVSLHNWPQDSQPRPGGSLLAQLRWTGRTTMFSGWKSLLRSGPDFKLTVDGMDGWQRVWRETDDDSRFRRSPWPGEKVAEFAAALPNSFDSGTFVSSDVKATDGGPPGCLIGRLRLPRPLTFQRAAVIGHRPGLTAAGNRHRGPTKTIEIDLKRQDLGKFISVGDWPDGTLFVASGSGNRFSSPIRVRDKSLQIRFEQTGDKPLVILPRHINDETGERAFMTIRNGHIILSGGSFHVRSSPTKAPIKWFLSITDGGFSLERCVLVGPMRESPGYKGLIHWKQTAMTASTRPSRPLPRRSGHISDSYLTTDRLLLDAEFRHSSLVMRNSILASLSDLFLLRIVGLDPKIGAAVDARHCTFSAGNSDFIVRATPFPKPSVDPLRFFVDESVFLRPVDVGPKRKTRPVVLTCPDLQRPQDQIDWWGADNGYARELTGYLENASTNGATQNFQTAWKTVWGTGHILRPLAKPGALLIQDEFPHRTRLTPAAFRLHRSSAAFAWSTVGKPVGADIDQLPKNNINLLSKPKRTPKKKKTKKGSANRPDF